MQFRRLDHGHHQGSNETIAQHARDVRTGEFVVKHVYIDAADAARVADGDGVAGEFTAVFFRESAHEMVDGFGEDGG